MPANLTLLEAITILRQRKVDEVSADEVAGLRACLESNPALATMAGGAEAVQQYIAAAEAALMRQAEAKASVESSSVSTTETARPGRKRRIVELAAYAILVLAAGVGLYLFIRPTEPDKPAAVKDSKPAKKSAEVVKPKAENNSAESKRPAPEKVSSEKPGTVKPIEPKSKEDAAADSSRQPEPEPEGPNDWRGWRMTFAPDVKLEKKTEWDRTDPSNPEPAAALVVRGGPLKLARDAAIASDTPWLMVHVRPNSVAAPPGQIVVSIDGKEVAKAAIGAGQTDWPLYVPLSDSSGAKRHLEVVFAPGNPKQEITFWNLQWVGSQKRKAVPESPLIASLRSEDSATRVQGATAAGDVVDLFVVYALVKALKDSHRDVRKTAAASLAKYNNDDSFRLVSDALVGSLADADPEVRKTAAASLMAFVVPPHSTGGAPATSPQKVAIYEVLCKAMLDHPDFDLRWQLSQQLTGQKDSKILAAFGQLLGSPDDRLRLAAVVGLGQIPEVAATPFIMQALADPEPGVRRTAAQRLSERSDPAADAAMTTALSSHPDGLIRRIAMTRARIRSTGLPLPAIREALKSPDDQLRRLVPPALLNVEDNESHALLDQLMNDLDPQVRTQAAEVLIRKRGSQADEILLKVAATHPDAAIRSIAITRFLTLSPFTPRAIEVLRETIKSPSPTLRYNSIVALEGIRRGIVERVRQAVPHNRRTPADVRAIEAVQKALSESPGPEILAILTPTLDDPYPLVWEGAANAFCNDPTVQANPIIFSVMAKSPNQLLRRRAALHCANSELIVPTAQYKDSLLALLQYPDPETRRWALKSISRLPDTKSIVEPYLDDSSSQVREIAATILGKNPATLSDAALLPAEAQGAGPQAIAALAGLLQSPRASLRQAAALRLKDIPDPAAEEAMLQALQSHPDVVVRHTAALRFANHFPTPKALGPAKAALSSPDAEVRAAAATALSKLNTPEAFAATAPLVRDPEMNVRLAAVAMLVNNPTPAAEDLAIGVIQSSQDYRMVAHAAARLGRWLSPRGLEVLKPLLKHHDTEVRLGALNAICQLKDPSVVPIVASGLEDADPSVAQHAANLLAARTEPAVKDIMLAALNSHRDTAVRRVAMAWFQQHPKPQVISALAASLTHDDDALRVTVVHSLATNPAPEATALIVQLIGDTVYEVRSAAAAALSARRDPQAESAALQLLSTGDIEIRRQMAVRYHAIPSPKAVAPLSAALKDADDQLRSTAVMALRSIATPEATEAIISALGDSSPGIRGVALDSLSQRQDPRAQAAAKEYKAKLTAGN